MLLTFLVSTNIACMYVMGVRVCRACACVRASKTCVRGSVSPSQLQEVKKLNSPGLESQDASTLGESWTIFAPWLGAADKVIELEHAVAASIAVNDSNFGFAPMPELEKALSAAVVSVPGMRAGLSLDAATDMFMQRWFLQLTDAKKVLVDVFEHFDDNDDQVTLPPHQTPELGSCSRAGYLFFRGSTVRMKS